MPTRFTGWFRSYDNDGNPIKGADRFDTSKNELRYSIKNTLNMDWGKQVDSYINNTGKIKRSDTLVVSVDTHDFLVNEGIENRPLAVPLSVLNKSRNGKDKSHNFSKSDLLSLSDDIKHCDIVIDDVDRNSLVFVKLKGDKLIVVAAFEKNVDFDGDKVHKATTVHHRQYIAPMISKLSENSTIYIKSKKELDTLSRRVGMIPTAYNSKIKFFDDIVSEYVPNVKFSSKNSDNVKSEDLVTYDDNEDVIKGADRFDTSKNELRYSGKVDVDAFDGVGYNIINTTGKRGYNELKREVMTWDDIKYLNQVRCTYLSSKGFYIYKMLDNETHDIIIYRANTQNAKRQQRFIERLYRNGAYDATVSVSRLIENYRNTSINNSKLSRDGQKESRNDVNVNVGTLREKRNDNRRGITENDSNDNLQKITFSAKSTIEETPNLVAVHSISEANLLRTLDLGAFPMPSIAIMSIDDALANDIFGNISIVFDKSAVAPEDNKDNLIYSTDAYTPIFPKVSVKLDADKVHYSFLKQT